jgi:LysR family glycine cleavage system transcriptional activator
MADVLARLPLSAIRVFEAAARLKSFTRAAEELGVTQAAVSWQVKALEQQLDQPLFNRLPREVTLTPPGERLSRVATEALSLLRSAVSDLVETEEGVLSITTVQSLGGQWLAPRLGGFQIAHPRIAVRLEASSRVADLAREGIDMALRGGQGRWAGVTSHFLIPAVQTPLCTPEFLARVGGVEWPDDLMDLPRIGIAREWAEWFQAAGVAGADRAAPRLASDAQALEVASALAHHGVALGSPIFFARELAEKRLVMPFDDRGPLHRRLLAGLSQRPGQGAQDRRLPRLGAGPGRRRSADRPLRRHGAHGDGPDTSPLSRAET